MRHLGFTEQQARAAGERAALLGARIMADRMRAADRFEGQACKWAAVDPRAANRAARAARIIRNKLARGAYEAR